MVKRSRNSCVEITRVGVASNALPVHRWPTGENAGLSVMSIAVWPTAAGGAADPSAPASLRQDPRMSPVVVSTKIRYFSATSGLHQFGVFHRRQVKQITGRGHLREQMPHDRW